MPIISAFIFSSVIAISGFQEIHRFIPTSTVVRVASMAANDEGYKVGEKGCYLDELRVDGKEPLPGYTSIGLYLDSRLIRSYSIRVDTGDVIDPMNCMIFRYPNLLKFKRETLKALHTKEVSIEFMAEEVGCDTLEVVPAVKPPNKPK